MDAAGAVALVDPRLLREQGQASSTYLRVPWMTRAHTTRQHATLVRSSLPTAWVICSQVSMLAAAAIRYSPDRKSNC